MLVYPNRLPFCKCLSLKGEMVKVENTNTYNMTHVSRDVTGEYKCSLVDNPMMEATKVITVNCKTNENSTLCTFVMMSPSAFSLVSYYD